MAECLEELEPPVSPTTSFDASFPRANASALSLSHLPPIQLPPFDGKCEDWEQFRNRFLSVIGENKDLTNFTKMHFLKSCLKGRALECVADIAVTGDNFELAWQSLISRFESKRRLLSLHLSTLINLPTISKESSVELLALRDKVNVAISSLKNLKRTPAELWNDLLVHLVAQTLDSVTRKAWNVKSSDTDEPPSFDDLSKFLHSRARALEEFSRNTNGKTLSTKSSTPQRVNAATATKISQTSCPLCKAKHFFSACPTFIRGSPSQRRDLVKQHRRCFNCLSQNHAAKECKSTFSCRTCQQRHHSLLHETSDSSNKANSSASAPSDSPAISQSSESAASSSTVQSLFTSARAAAHSQILLATAWLTVRASSGRALVVRALLDQGSEMTFISEQLAQTLRITRFRMPVSIAAVGCVHAGNFGKAAHISVSPRDSLSPSYSTTALILPKLTLYAPKLGIDISPFAHLSDLKWADSDPGSSESIDVILGADLYGEVLLDGVRKGESS
ncbi:hypothetical protein X777_05355 [Ooceraea biroi]|uniref:Uncharacterized protein n=1 Tax=Ooceraea biroi TaxID=2015173 RepID=A0A026WGF0_OOCBI|nr:hypothetical protein X777_05355 [Ooceraea biroi]